MWMREERESVKCCVCCITVRVGKANMENVIDRTAECANAEKSDRQFANIAEKTLVMSGHYCMCWKNQHGKCDRPHGGVCQCGEK